MSLLTIICNTALSAQQGTTKKLKPAQKNNEGLLGLKILVLVAGAVLMALEIVGSRLLAPHFGNSVYVWGSLISVFLIALSLGYWVGGHLADRRPSLSLLIGLCVIVAALIFLIPWIGHPLCRLILDAGFGEQTGPLAAASILFLPPSFLLGMVSPFSVRITTKNVQSVGRAAGSLYALSTIGSIIGTLSTTFVLIPLVGVSSILKGLGITMALLPIAVALMGKKKTATIVAGIIIGSIGVSIHSIPSFRITSNSTLIIDQDTPYHHISVVDMANTQRFLLFDRFVESSIQLQPPYASTVEYTNYFHLAFLLKPDIKNTLFIGAGGGIGPRTFSEINPDMQIDVVDIDRRVLELAESHFYMPKSPNIHPITSDGRTFFHRSPGPYDCVVLDAFTVGGRIPFHLTTREYFELVRSHMTQDGIFVMNISSALTGKKGEIYRAVTRTLQDIFPRVFTFANGLYQKPDREQTRNIILVATVNPNDIHSNDLLAALPNYQERTYITQSMIRSMIANLIDLAPNLSATLPLTDDLAPIETMSF